MTKTGLFGGAMALTWMFTGQAAFAQETAPAAERLPDLRIETRDTAPPAPAYTASDPVDSGASVISRRAIEDRTPGSGDVIETLKILPFANFDADQGRVTQAGIQDLRPANVSISGGQFYDNAFMIDGVGVNSRLDVVGNTNAQNFNETVGASAQSIWLDSNLVDTVIVRDSNISAQYGGFTGGVVQIDTRAPAHVFGGSLTYGCTNDEMTSFKIPSNTLAALGGVAPEAPNYSKCRLNATVDLPINDRLRLLLGAGSQEVKETYYRAAAYGGAPFGLKSRSENYLAKLEADLAPNLLLKGQVAYSPYRSQNTATNSRDALMTQHGGGWTGKLTLEGKRDKADWSLEATYARSDSGREAPANLFTWPTTSTYANWCSSANCVEGSFGDLDQWQEDLGLKARWSQPVLGGELRLGADYSHVEARKRRPQDNYAYRTALTNATTKALTRNVTCSDGDLACKTGDVGLTVYSLYKAYDISVALDAVSAFAEYEVSRGPLTVRGGVRYDHESLLGNNNFAPRLSVVYALPWDVTATLGANRYYTRDFLGYALKSKYPGNYVYGRTATLVNGQYVFNPWTLTTHSISANYGGVGLATPYSDELTFALARPLFGGQARIKGVARETRDQFTAGTVETNTYVKETGGTATYKTTYLGNDGKTRYRGLSAEWTRQMGRHAFSLNGSISDTSDNMADDSYNSDADDAEYGDEAIYYKGQVRSLLSVLTESQRLNYAAPALANADWSAEWWKGRVRTNLNARWRSGYDTVGETSQTQTVDGVRYAVWDDVRYKSTTTFNASVQAQLVKTAAGTASLDVRITNLFDTLPQTVTASSTSQPFRLGRSFWVGVNYKF